MVGGFESEEGRRREALRLVAEEGMGVEDAAVAVGRTRRWLSKWKQLDEAGESLESRSTAPRTQPTKTAEEMVELVLEYRARLEADPVASIGGLSIVAGPVMDSV